MTIHDIINYFPEKYICVHNTKRNALQLITEADILCVYDTLRIAAENKNMIKRYMQQYPDFDIIFGDYGDYFYTRYLHNMTLHSVKLEEYVNCVTTQCEPYSVPLHYKFLEIRKATR